MSSESNWNSTHERLQTVAMCSMPGSMARDDWGTRDIQEDNTQSQGNNAGMFIRSPRMCFKAYQQEQNEWLDTGKQDLRYTGGFSPVECKVWSSGSIFHLNLFCDPVGWIHSINNFLKENQVNQNRNMLDLTANISQLKRCTKHGLNVQSSELTKWAENSLIWP